MNEFAKGSYTRPVLLLLLVLSLGACLFAQQRYPATGLVLQIDRSRNLAVISCNAIPGYMEAMAMPYSVLADRELADLNVAGRVQPVAAEAPVPDRAC